MAQKSKIGEPGVEGQIGIKTISNPDKPEKTNYKHQLTNKFQLTISKSQ
jgi:hypothetical protein